MNIDLAKIKEWFKSLADLLVRNPFFLSAVEAIVVFIFSNAALPFYVFAHAVSTPNETVTLPLAIQLMKDALSPTETLVYILALIAPALWVMFYRWRARRHPLVYFTLLSIQGILIVTSAYIYGRAKFGTIENASFVSSWGSWCYGLGLATWYITLVYDKWLKNVVIPPPMPSGEQILANLGGR